MRERGQASVELIALIAVALAVAAALLFGLARFGPPLTATIVGALSGASAPGPSNAPGLDRLETTLLAAATSPDAEGPTVLDVRTRLRARLGKVAGDAAFLAVLRPLVERALPANAADLQIESIGVTDNASELTWLRRRLHPDLWVRSAEVAIGSSGPIGGAYSLAASLGLLGGDEPGGMAPGAAAGDVLVALEGRRRLVFRRREDTGLTVVGDLTLPWRAGPA